MLEGGKDYAAFHGSRGSSPIINRLNNPELLFRKWKYSEKPETICSLHTDTNLTVNRLTTKRYSMLTPETKELISLVAVGTIFLWRRNTADTGRRIKARDVRIRLTALNFGLSLRGY